MGTLKKFEVQGRDGVEEVFGNDLTKMFGWKTIARVDDFRFTGLLFIRKENIREISLDCNDRFYALAYQSNEEELPVGYMAALESKTVDELIRICTENSTIVSFEHSSEFDFEIGVFKSIEGRVVSVATLSSDGVWEPVKRVPLNTISRFDLFDPYCVGLERHFRLS